MMPAQRHNAEPKRRCPPPHAVHPPKCIAATATSSPPAAQPASSVSSQAGGAGRLHCGEASGLAGFRCPANLITAAPACTAEALPA